MYDVTKAQRIGETWMLSWSKLAKLTDVKDIKDFSTLFIIQVAMRKCLKILNLSQF